jgi:hypothetical protein
MMRSNAEVTALPWPRIASKHQERLAWPHLSTTVRLRLHSHSWNLANLTAVDVLAGDWLGKQVPFPLSSRRFCLWPLAQTLQCYLLPAAAGNLVAGIADAYDDMHNSSFVAVLCRIPAQASIPSAR